jgi:trehalose 6-phosphate phosphatase
LNRPTGYRRIWVFDFDGTISSIVPDRNSACLHPEWRGLLKDLLQAPDFSVAVLSSREIEDLSRRVPLPGIILGGASGLIWHLPGGKRICPGAEAMTRRQESLSAIAPLLSRLGAFPGVEIENKGWSLAVHYRNVLPEAAAGLQPLLEELKQTKKIRVFRGPSVAEAQLLLRGNKSYGVRRLCRLLGVDPSMALLLYAGDDENDAAAMRWVLKKGGVAFCVGKHVNIPGARVVETPGELARAVRELV